MTAREQVDALTVRRVRRLMCVFTGLLVAATWPLWTPGSEFPDIPWLEWFSRVNASWLDWAGLIALFALLVLEFRGLPSSQARTWLLRRALWGPMLFALLVDQHRLQPWVWHSLLMATLLAVSEERTAVRGLRALTVSIYFWSAVSKIDMAFLQSHGQWLLQGLTASLGVSTALWSETTKLAMAAVFPAWELLTAVALMFLRTRRLGLGMAIVMHSLLLLSLGPLGHNQLPAVLIWNVFFIGLDVLLFAKPSAAPEAGSNRNVTFAVRPRTVIASSLAGMMCLLPALSSWGWWDNWPSWAVYSSRPAIVEVFVPHAKVDDLPASLREFVGPPAPLSDWRPVNLDAWSFATLWCPIYPQERYRLAVAAALGKRHEIADLRVIIHSPPARWTGERTMVRLDGQHAMLQWMHERFWLNTSEREGRSVRPEN